MHQPVAVIIGSGIGGMATAVRLAVAGFDVTIFEKNSHPGGKLSAFKMDGYHFDAGPSLFTQPENIEALFKLANEPITEYINWQQVPISCKYFYENGKTVNAYTDPVLFSQELQTQLGENAAKVIGYLGRSKKLYNNIGNLFLNNSLHKLKTWVSSKLFTALGTLRLGYLFTSLHNYNKKYFRSPEAVQLFDRFATYNGSDPYKAPSMLSLIPHLELEHGTFYPAGGMISITNAIYQLALKKGIKFNFDTPVQRVIHTEGKIKGVVVNGKNIKAEVIVSNADVYFTYTNLLLDQRLAKRVLKQERSSSAVIFYWGMKKQFDQLQLHNIFFSADYANEFKSIFATSGLSDDPTIYLNITAKMEPTQAPEGKENWFLLINAPANKGQDWNELKQQLRHAVIKKLSAILQEDIGSLIATEQVTDPVLIEAQTASYMGSLYGTSSNSKMAAFLRHANFNRDIKGLYFCGGSVHPGGGIPLCLKSAGIVSELIEKDVTCHAH